MRLPKQQMPRVRKGLATGVEGPSTSVSVRRDGVREAPVPTRRRPAGARGEGECLATGVEGSSTSVSTSTVRVLTAAVLQTQNELNTLVG